MLPFEVKPDKLRALLVRLGVPYRTADALEVFSFMRSTRQTCKPNNETFAILVRAFLKMGDVKTAQGLVQSMAVRACGLPHDEMCAWFVVVRVVN